MLDIKLIREKPDLIKTTLKNKNLEGAVDVDLLLTNDQKVRDITVQLDDLRRQRNELDGKIKTAKDNDERQKYIQEATELKPKVKELEDQQKGISDELESQLLKLPNITDPKMPVGKDESGNVVLRKWGKPQKFNFEVKDHIGLGKDLDIIDVEKSGEISGSRFAYLKNEAVLLQFALINLTLETLMSAETIKELAEKTGNPFTATFKPVLPPVMIKPEIMAKMDRLDPIEERYEMKRDELILVGSAEHTLGPYHMNETFSEEDLPIRYIGYSTAFRREAGSHGKDVKGIIRVHQFDKLEMETYVPKEYGAVEQEFILAIQEHLVQKLEIPYQVIQVCTGDTGKPDYNQYDIECWVPSQNKYRETHTSDYMTDFQSRRLNIRYKNKDGENEYVHMNDATAFAIGRILVAILENNQQEDGSVVVPEALRKHTGFEKITPTN